MSEKENREISISRKYKTFKEISDMWNNFEYFLLGIIYYNLRSTIKETWIETKIHFGKDFPFDDFLKIIFKRDDN